MSEESKKEEPILIPESEDIPEKFWGKPVSDLAVSYKEAEKNMHEKTEETGGLKKENDILRSQLEEKKEPEEEPENTENFDYMTKGDFLKALSEQKKEISEQLKKSKEETANQTTWEFEKRQFLSKHPELSETDINTIAVVGINAGTKTLDESYKAFQGLAEKFGLKQGEEPRVISTNITGGEQVQEDKDDGIFSDKWVEKQKTRVKGISATLGK